jgi:transposase
MFLLVLRLKITIILVLGEYDTLCPETLSASNMVENHYLAGSINDISWAGYNRILEY